MSSKVKPIGKQVLIRIVKDTALAGIILPEGVKGNTNDKAFVEEVGTQCELGVKVGHQVMLRADAKGITIEKDLHILPESAIAAVLNWED